MIIGLVGRIGSGKGTIGDVLVEEFGYKKVSWADPLKDATAAAFGWPRHLLEGDTKESREFRETPCPRWSKSMGRDFTPREALQKVGTELFRNHIHQDFWVEAMKNRIAQDPNSNYVIPDTRFHNEVAMIRATGGKILYVHPPIQEEWILDILAADFPYLPAAPKDIHQSEWDWLYDPKPYDLEILNDKTAGLENFKDKIRWVANGGTFA